ncbi:MAG TPA: DUF2284 domain-containing protein [Desulfosporosinus sp.]|nr:DUF2284 domain-containing protein [Desulfosporosinus sp.]
MKKYVDLACSMGFNEAVYFDPQKVSFHDADILRDACKANYCGKHGKYWNCPPGMGTVKKREDIFYSYDHGIMMQLLTEPLNSALQGELYQEVATSVNMMGKALKENIKKEYDDVYLMGMSGCTLCDVCSYPVEECRHPDEVVTSISGNCINVYRLWESTGLTRPGMDMTDLYVIILYKNKTQSHQDQSLNKELTI